MTDHGARVHQCRLTDGTLLGGLLWRAARPGGIVIVRTPYSAGRHAATARSWNARGYHCLVQDVRGRYRSAGTWAPYTHEGADGGAALAQVAEEHPGLPLVLFGASYAAHTALEAARSAAATGVPVSAAIAAVPALGLAETARDHHGTPHYLHRIGWWHEHGRHRTSRPPLDAGELRRRAEQARTRGPVAAAQEWGWTAEALEEWQRLWTAERLDLPARYGRLSTPLLVIGGDADFFADDAVHLARSWGGPSHYLGGPWGHGLVGGMPDTGLRRRIRAAGGLPHVIDAWMAAHGLPGAPAPWTAPLASARRTRTLFDPASATWRHERTSP
ncbi:CocE/NonD family hydrolase [Nocardiopsis coralliicola]